MLKRENPPCAVNRQGGPEADTKILHRFLAGTIAVPAGGRGQHDGPHHRSRYRNGQQND